jgi:hypothetical protein
MASKIEEQAEEGEQVTNYDDQQSNEGGCECEDTAELMGALLD